MASTLEGVDNRAEDMKVGLTSEEVQDNIDPPNQFDSQPTEVEDQLETAPQSPSNGTDPMEIATQEQAQIGPMPGRVGAADTNFRNGSPATTQMAVPLLPSKSRDRCTEYQHHRQPLEQPQPPHHLIGPQHHQPQNRRRVLPASHSQTQTMANLFDDGGWMNQSAYGEQNTGYGYSHSPAHTSFSPVFPRSMDGKFMDPAASYLGQNGVDPFSNQYTVYQNLNAGPVSGVGQEYIPHPRDFHQAYNLGFGQNGQFTASPAAFGYGQNYHSHGSSSSTPGPVLDHPYHDEYQTPPLQQQYVGNRPLEYHQQSTHRHASIDGDGNQFDDDYAGEEHGIENGEDSTADSVFGDVFGESSGFPEADPEHQSPHERSELFVYDSDGGGYDHDDNDNDDSSLQARRRRDKGKGVVRIYNRNGSGGVPRGTNSSFAGPVGTASEYRPSRWSGAPIQQAMRNQTPETKDGRYVSEASLKKRGLNRVMKNRVAKRASGANDPENLKIVQLYDNCSMPYEEIAQVINDDRRKKGRAPDLTGNAVSARYIRTAPILYKAEGKPWVPPSKRKGATTGPVSIWNADLDLKMVKIKQEVDATTWQQVAERFNRETGNNFTIEQISTRWAAI